MIFAQNDTRRRLDSEQKKNNLNGCFYDAKACDASVSPSICSLGIEQSEAYQGVVGRLTILAIFDIITQRKAVDAMNKQNIINALSELL